ncbi:2-deoxy-D-gluconate 3-dehydrogenase [Parafrankia irregularis]|uniref:2-deoxy-D-gluconate 3-dehydrogenase n=1 Tax=Parafrankia irregularis TaxID=795642 RepID=A0A0S4QX25_9ACTN|nr:MULTISPECIES: SDR family oxidoreductase [Parafrankia]MBE3201510.1 SDR family oxidoreductase [Parafrankia sp. CH37]CUU59420.1 2-deoxy-D-gluconate 3-dehydrogenase [Parafrankia irregularis]
MTDTTDLLAGAPPRPPLPFDVTGKVALVTGGARGIGYATAHRFLEAGAAVAVNDIDEAALEAAVAELRTVGPPVLALPADVGDVERHRPMIERTVAELGRLDVLVNNAGTFQPTPLDALDPALVDQLFAVNVKGLLFLSAAAAEVMSPGGSIVNVSSLGGVRPPFGGLAVYHATKGAVDSLTRDMAITWGPRGIRVNGAGPGGILTEGRDQVTAHPLFPPEMMAEIMGRATGRPLGRMGYADDLAMVILFLTTPAAGFITGQQILVDGGYYYA